MNQHPAPFIGSPYYYNCKDCGRELWSERARKMGLCMRCLEIHVHQSLIRLPVLAVKVPTSKVHLN
jgi:hypothetical protein